MCRILIILACAAALTACAPVPKKPDEPKHETVVEAPPRPGKMAKLALNSPPERDAIREMHRFNRAITTTPVKGLRYYFFEPMHEQEVVGFSLTNTGSPEINPRGVLRQYTFLFPDRARENIHLVINDDVRLSGRYSHDNMFRELHFFPRRQLPSITVDQASGLLKVTLPTGEPVTFHRDTLEMAGGVLREWPIDFNPSRFQRNNPTVLYQGDYLAISVEQRGEAPRKASVWGQTKYATVHYPAKYSKACRLSPRHIWDQRPKRGDNEPRLTMLHATDESLFRTIEKQCRWDLTALREPQEMANWGQDTSR